MASDREQLKPLAKVGIVVGGYAVALTLAFVVVAVNVTLTSTPDRLASSGMSAFGDSLLFLVVFGLLATLPSAAALYFLRTVKAFWTGLSAIALASIATVLVSLAVYVAAGNAEPGSALAAWSAVAVLRILAAPLISVTFLLAGLFSPDRRARTILLAACCLEAAIFIATVILWLRPRAI